MASLTDPVTNKPNQKRVSPTVAAFILLIARGFAAAVMALSTLLMAWVLPAENVGQALTLVSAAMLASILVSLNAESGAIHFIVQARKNGRPDIVHGFLHFSRRLILVLAVPSMLGFIVLGAFVETGISPITIVLAACLIPLFALTRSTARQAGALQEVLRGGLPQLVLRPLVVVSGLGVAAFTIGSLTTETVLLLFLCGAALTAISQNVLLRPVLNPIQSTRITDTNAPEWAVHGLRLAPSLLFQDLLRDLLLVLAAVGLSDAKAGVLAICLTVILVPNLALIAIEMGFGPPIAAAGADRDRSRQSGLLRQSATLRLISVVPTVVLIQIFCVPVLEIFGPEYREGETALRLLSLIPLVKALFGNPVLLLNVAGKSTEILKISGQGLVLVCMIIPAAASVFGLIGAALASALGYGIVQYRLYASCIRSNISDPSALALLRKLAEDKASA